MQIKFINTPGGFIRSYMWLESGELTVSHTPDVRFAHPFTNFEQAVIVGAAWQKQQNTPRKWFCIMEASIELAC